MMTTKKTATFFMTALLAAAVQMTASASGTIPGTNIQYDHYLTKSDSSIYSLTTGRESQNWSDGYTIQAEDENVALYIPAGLTAYATKETQTIVPKIYCAGRVSNSGTSGLIFEFNNLFLLEGGEMQQSGRRKPGRDGSARSYPKRTGMATSSIPSSTGRWEPSCRLGRLV